jgi:hypothetical protein
MRNFFMVGRISPVCCCIFTASAITREKIKRVAAVTDSHFLAILPKVADYFAAAEVRHFDYQGHAHVSQPVPAVL